MINLDAKNIMLFIVVVIAMIDLVALFVFIPRLKN